MGLSRAPHTHAAIRIPLIIAVLCHCAFAKVIYVDDDATGTNDGTSWANAYVDLQDALADAGDSPKPIEIRVAQGIYKPDRGMDQTAGNRNATFRLARDVILIGGYAGHEKLDPNEWDTGLYESILSGDLQGDDQDVTHVRDLRDDPTRADNSSRIVLAQETDRSAVLTGFVITGGHHGGGVFISEASAVTMSHCKITGNTSLGHGGGVYCDRNSTPIIEHCEIVFNAARDGGGLMANTGSAAEILDCTISGNDATADGGGVYVEQEEGSPTFTRCVFSDNHSDSEGGAINIDSGTSPQLLQCVFYRNIATRTGGGIYCDADSEPLIRRCSIRANQSYGVGGGVYCDDESNPRIEGCDIIGNSANMAGGICCNEGSRPSILNCTISGNLALSGGGMYCQDSSPSLLNCILWDNAPEGVFIIEGTPVISHSDVEGGWPGITNIDEDPLFADPGYWVDMHDPNVTVETYDANAMWVEGDYHLQSEAGRWDPNNQSWVSDDATSPCIDAGDPNSDWSGETWPHGEHINMGAYGGTQQASMSLRTEGLSLAHVAFVFSHDAEVAQSFESLLGFYGCPTTLIRLADIPATSLDSYDLVIVANDTQYETTWSDPNAVAAIEDSDKPVVGLGEGGYDFFGLLGLSIGSPNGGHGRKNSIEPVDPESSLFRTPYYIEIPEDRAVQLYTETEHVGLYFWPTVPQTVTVLGKEVGDTGFYPLAMEHDRYLLWGFTGSPEEMTEAGKRLFINIVIRTANRDWGS